MDTFRHENCFWHVLTRKICVSLEFRHFFDTFWHVLTRFDTFWHVFLTRFDTFWHALTRFLTRFDTVSKKIDTRPFLTLFDTFWHSPKTLGCLTFHTFVGTFWHIWIIFDTVSGFNSDICRLNRTFGGVPRNFWNIVFHNRWCAQHFWTTSERH